MERGPDELIAILSKNTSKHSVSGHVPLTIALSYSYLGIVSNWLQAEALTVEKGGMAAGGQMEICPLFCCLLSAHSK